MRILLQRLAATRQQESRSDAAVILLLSYSILAFLVFLFCFNFPPASSHLPSFLCPTSSLTLPTSPPLYFSLRAGVRSGRATRPPAPQSHWLLYALFDSVSFCNTCSLSFTPRLQRSWIITVSYEKRRECRGDRLLIDIVVVVAAAERLCQSYQRSGQSPFLPIPSSCPRGEQPHHPSLSSELAMAKTQKED